MAEKQIINARVWQKVDTLSGWNANPLILGDGEQAFVRNNGVVINYRIGDGTKRFSELPNLIAYDQAAYVAPIGNTLPVPQNGVGYSILAPGTYNSGDIVVPVGSLGIADYASGAWGVRNMVLPANPARISTYVPGDKGTGDIALSNGVYYSAKRATSDAPSLSSVDWDLFLPAQSLTANIYNTSGYVEKGNGNIIPGADFVVTPFIALNRSQEIIVSGYSGRDDAAALIGFYDSERRFLSSYNTTAQGWVNNVTIPTSVYPANAVYVRFTKPLAMVDNLHGGVDLLMRPSFWQSYIDTPLNTLRLSQSALANRNLEGFYSTVGYVEKGNGRIVTEASLRASTFLKINRSEALVVTGYSGRDDSAALVGFYDENYLFISAYNANVQGLVTNHTVPAASIPTNAVYARFTRSSAQTLANPIVSGVYRYMTDLDNLKLVEGYFGRINYVDSLAGYFSMVGYVHKRTGDITPDLGFVCTRFIRINNRSVSITISGYSGRDDNAALCAFYDIRYNLISVVNSPTQGIVENYVVPASSIPSNAMFMRSCSTAIHVNRRVAGSGISLVATFNDAINFGDALNRNIKELRSETHIPFNDTVRIKNYLGNYQNIHPKVLYFDTPLWGYRYWMAYTPFPFEFDQQENPCIAVSNDGVEWTVPQGMVNPLATPPPNGGYNSDTHLVYREDLQQLECWYRPVFTTGAELHRRVTTNGVNWNQAEKIQDISGVLSPSIIFEDNKYKLWYPTVRTEIAYTESAGSEPNGWSAPAMIPTGDVVCWHLDVVKSTRGTEYIIQGWNTGEGDNFTSAMFYKKDAGKTVKILSLENLPAYKKGMYNGLYRGSFVYVNGLYRLYYSYIRKDRYQGMVLAEGEDILRLLPYNADLSPESKTMIIDQNRDIRTLYTHSAETIHIKDANVTIRSFSGMRPNAIINIVVTGSGSCTLVSGDGIDQNFVVNQANSPKQLLSINSSSIKSL